MNWSRGWWPLASSVAAAVALTGGAACGPPTLVLDAGDSAAGSETDATDVGDTAPGTDASTATSESGGDGDGSGDGDGDGNQDGTTGDGDAEWCESAKVIYPYSPRAIMLVYDKTASMFTPTFDDGQGGLTTKWSALHAATTDLIHAYPQELFLLGAQLVPQAGTTDVSSIDACAIATPPDAPMTPPPTEVLSQIPIANPFSSMEGGATPTAAATRAADAYQTDLLSLDDIFEYLIVVTDDAPNCRPDLVEAAIQCGDDPVCSQAALADALETYDDTAPEATVNAKANATFVIGLDILDFDPMSGIPCTSDADCPDRTACCSAAQGDTNCPVDSTCALLPGTAKNVNPAAALADFAAGGNHPNPPVTGYHDVTDAVELQAAFDDIVEAIPLCTWSIPTGDFPGLQDEAVTVRFGDQGGYGHCLDADDTPLPNCTPGFLDEAACETQNGVVRIETSPESLRFYACNDACEAYKTHGAIEFLYNACEDRP